VRTRSNCGLRRQPSTGDDPVQVPRHALQVALPSATRARHQRVVRIAWERMQAFTQSRQARAAQLAIRCHCPAVCALDGHVLQPGLRFSHPFFWATSQAPPDDLGACSGITRRAAPRCARFNARREQRRTPPHPHRREAVLGRRQPAALRSAGPARVPCHSALLHLPGKIDTLRYMAGLYIVLQSRLWLAFSRKPHLSMIAGSIRRRSLPDRQNGPPTSRSTATATVMPIVALP
jgi:hypothetical protein